MNEPCTLHNPDRNAQPQKSSTFSNHRINGSSPAERPLVHAKPGHRRDGRDMRGFHGDGAATAANGSGSRALARAERAELPAGAGLPVAVRELLHRQLLVAVRRVLQPDAGHVPVSGAMPLRRRGRGARPTRLRDRPGSAQRLQPASQRLLRYVLFSLSGIRYMAKEHPELFQLSDNSKIETENGVTVFIWCSVVDVCSCHRDLGLCSSWWLDGAVGGDAY